MTIIHGGVSDHDRKNVRFIKSSITLFRSLVLTKKLYENTCYMRGPDEYPLIMVSENTRGVTKGQ